MNLKEFTLFVKSLAMGRGVKEEALVDSIILMHLNNAIKRFAEYFPDVSYSVYEATATSGLSSISLPSDFRKFDKFYINDYQYYLTTSEFDYSRELTRRCWLSGDTLYFTPSTDNGDEIKLYYFTQPSDLTSMSDTIPFPEDTHYDLGLYVASFIAPTQDLFYERQRVERDFRHKYKRANPQREITLWKTKVKKDAIGEDTSNG